MARVQYGSLVHHFAGSIAGHTFQPNAYGHSVRTKPSQTSSFTALQESRRRAMQAIQSAWFNLTEINRGNWNNFSAYHFCGAKNNATSMLSGYALFVKYNLYRYLMAQAVFTNITYWNQSPTDHLTTIRLYAGALHWNIAPTTGNGSIYALLFLSNNHVSHGSFKGNRTRYIAYHNYANSETDISAAYIALYGALPAVGDIISLKEVLLNIYCPIMFFPAGRLVTVTT